MNFERMLRPRINELGKIKIGQKQAQERKTKSGGTYRAPEKIDHFLITTMQRSDNDDYIVDVPLMESLKEYADRDGKLRQIPIALLSNEIEDVLQCSYVWYNGKRVAWRSDGNGTMEVFYDRKKNEWYQQPRIVEWNPKFLEERDSYGNPLLKLNTTLNVVIASPEARWGGFYKFRTTSKISADQLYGSLVQIRELTYGILRGMPLRLVLRPIRVTPGGKTTTVYVVHIELLGRDLQAIQNQAISIARLEVENRKRIEQSRAEYKRMLALPGYGESEAEQREIAAEFYPQGLAEGEIPNEEPTPVVKIDPLTVKLGISDAIVDDKPAEEQVVITTPDDDWDDEPPLTDGELFDNSAEEREQLDNTK